MHLVYVVVSQLVVVYIRYVRVFFNGSGVYFC